MENTLVISSAEWVDILKFGSGRNKLCQGGNEYLSYTAVADMEMWGGGVVLRVFYECGGGG